MSDERRPWWADDVSQAWKWLASWIGIILGALPQLYDASPWLQAHMSLGMMHWIITVLAAGGVVNTLRNKDPAPVLIAGETKEATK